MQSFEPNQPGIGWNGPKSYLHRVLNLAENDLFFNSPKRLEKPTALIFIRGSLVVIEEHIYDIVLVSGHTLARDVHAGKFVQHIHDGSAPRSPIRKKNNPFVHA
mmetsp:Transcript_19272/g.62848  ORF Transcript_19272/g.62848 Transcript_19272/m.62848 type:complete len:104 (-) Transcript_19272:392-703(-)